MFCFFEQFNLCYLPIYRKSSTLRSLGDDDDYAINPSNKISKYISTSTLASSSSFRYTPCYLQNENVVTTSLDFDICWSEITLGNQGVNNLIISNGSFRPIIHSDYNPTGSTKIYQVAIKLVTISRPSHNSNVHVVTYAEAKDNFLIYKSLEKRIVSKDTIAKIFGIVQGPFPPQLVTHLNIPLSLTNNYFGLVVGFEGGGTLASFLQLVRRSTETAHSMNLTQHKQQQFTSLGTKLRILTGVLKGLAELHSVGIYHGRLTPENILLTENQTPKICNFSLLQMQAVGAGYNQLTSGLSFHELKYVAPEILRKSSFLFPSTDLLTKNTLRPQSANLALLLKSDIYSSAIIIWETLTQIRSFTEQYEINTIENDFINLLQSGYRPPIDSLASDCPSCIKDLIVTCWSTDPAKRMSSVGCCAVLNMANYTLPNSDLLKLDVYISYDDSCINQMQMAKYIFYHFYRKGFNVHFNYNYTTIRTLRVEHSKNWRIAVRNSPLILSTNIVGHIEAGQLIEVHANTVTGFYVIATGRHKDRYVNKQLYGVQYVDVTEEVSRSKCINDNLRNGIENNVKFELENLSNTDSIVDEATVETTLHITKATQLFIACINHRYQTNNLCLSEIREARCKPNPLTIAPIYLDPNPETWLNEEMKYYCQYGENPHEVDVSELRLSTDWSDGNETIRPGSIRKLNHVIDAIIDKITLV